MVPLFRLKWIIILIVLFCTVFEPQSLFGVFTCPKIIKSCEAKVTTDKTDRDIKNNIERELWWSIFVDSECITVSVEESVATLSGTVGSWHEFIEVVKNSFEGGALSVRSYLKNRENGAYYNLWYHRVPLWYDYIKTFPSVIEE